MLPPSTSSMLQRLTRTRICVASLSRVSTHLTPASSIYPANTYITHLRPSSSSSKPISKPKRLDLYISDATKIEVSKTGGVPKVTVTGDHIVLGTDSDEYFHLDTDPKSIDSGALPYENPKESGDQLRYGGRGYTANDDLEAFSGVNDSEADADGSKKERNGVESEKSVPIDKKTET